MLGHLLIVGLASSSSVPVLSVCEAMQKANDGRGLVRIEGELRHQVEIANYLTDPKCAGLIVIDSVTADKSYHDRPGDKQSNRGLRVVLEGQLVHRGGKSSVALLYRAKLIRITRKARDGA